MSFDFSRLMHGFTMENPVVLGTNGLGEPIVAYTSWSNGGATSRHLAHIRTLYEKGGRWCPSKAGVCFPAHEIVDVLVKMAERFVNGGGVSEDATAERPPAPISPPDFGARTVTEKMTAAVNKACEPTNQQWKAFLDLTAQLSPENLSCDGELSRSQIAARKRQIDAAWRSLEIDVGRKVTEDEAWAHYTTVQAARHRAEETKMPKMGNPLEALAAKLDSKKASNARQTVQKRRSRRV